VAREEIKNHFLPVTLLLADCAGAFLASLKSSLDMKVRLFSPLKTHGELRIGKKVPRNLALTK